MSSREDFGEPLGSDLLLAIGEVYFRRGQLIDGVRAFFSAVPREQAVSVMQAAIIELSSGPDA